MLECKLCDFKTESQLSLSKHTVSCHKLKFPDYLIQIKYNGIHPMCACGCGEETRYEATKADFCKFIHGHQSRLAGHWGDLKSEKRVNAISEARKKRFASGEYDHHLKVLRKSRTQKTIDKITQTKKLNPYKHTDMAKCAISEFRKQFKFSEESKEKMSQTAINNIIKTDQNHSSKLEEKFAELLDSLNIHYTRFYYAKDIKAFYDFYIPKYNVLIEVDGDFWHCNPNTKFAIPEYKTQHNNLVRDKQKNEWAQQNGYKLIRFWENDINNDATKIKNVLLENLTPQ